MENYRNHPTRHRVLCLRANLGKNVARRISSFRIIPDDPGSTLKKGRLAPCDPRTDPGVQGCMVHHRNYRGFSYEENHLEEWIARDPSALFGETEVLLLASQNYRHLRVKIDLLFVDGMCQLYPVELKVEPIAKNGGVVPYDLYERQMKPYVKFLLELGKVTDLASNYLRFSKSFHGAERQIAHDFATCFEGKSCEKQPTTICETYVAEQFDAYALEYFERNARDDQRNIRLVQYKFFPTNDYLEFWEIYRSEEIYR